MKKPGFKTSEFLLVGLTLLLIILNKKLNLGLTNVECVELIGLVLGYAGLRTKKKIEEDKGAGK